MWLATLSALVTVERSQLDCPRLSSHGAYHLFAGSAKRDPDGESHGDCPAPATTWRAALSAWQAADCAQLDCPHSPGREFTSTFHLQLVCNRLKRISKHRQTSPRNEKIFK